MFRIVIVYATLLLTLAALSAGQQQPSSMAGRPSAQRPGARTQPAKPPAPATTAPAPAQAEALPTPEQGPSSPPQVTFQGGQLTIVARNSTMSDVLNAVKQKTGAAVDMPAVSSERVVGVFGPGAPRDIIAQLLNGSHYDYVLLGSPADPGALKKIVLMARVAGPEAASQQQQQISQQVSNPQNPPQVDEEPDTELPAPDAAEVQQAPDEESQQPDQNLQQENQNPNGPVVKTPEQLLRELQQQQQQQQQQQNPPQQ